MSVSLSDSRSRPAASPPLPCSNCVSTSGFPLVRHRHPRSRFHTCPKHRSRGFSPPQRDSHPALQVCCTLQPVWGSLCCCESARPGHPVSSFPRCHHLGPLEPDLASTTHRGRPTCFHMGPVNGSLRPPRTSLRPKTMHPKMTGFSEALLPQRLFPSERSPRPSTGCPSGQHRSARFTETAIPSWC